MTIKETRAQTFSSFLDRFDIGNILLYATTGTKVVGRLFVDKYIIHITYTNSKSMVNTVI